MSPRVCTVCVHSERADIDAALVAGTPSLRNIAARFGTSPTALHRHKRDHLPQELGKTQDAQEIASAGDLFAEVQRLQARAVCILETAERSGALNVALNAMREARSCIELMANFLFAAEEIERRSPPPITVEALDAEIERLVAELATRTDISPPRERSVRLLTDAELEQEMAESLREAGYTVTKG
jgi:hypothetical protein